MKVALQRYIVFGLTSVLLGGCSQQPAEQSVVVTAANETAAMTRLRAIAAAEAQYQVQSLGEYGTLDQLIQKRYVNDPASGKLTGYRFEVQIRPGGFQATAVPEKFGVTGKRSFYLDETNVLHGSDKKGAPATAADPEV
jgi:hypothetical protein